MCLGHMQILHHIIQGSWACMHFDNLKGQEISPPKSQGMTVNFSCLPWPVGGKIFCPFLFGDLHHISPFSCSASATVACSLVLRDLDCLECCAPRLSNNGSFSSLWSHCIAEPSLRHIHHIQTFISTTAHISNWNYLHLFFIYCQPRDSDENIDPILFASLFQYLV